MSSIVTKDKNIITILPNNKNEGYYVIETTCIKHIINETTEKIVVKMYKDTFTSNDIYYFPLYNVVVFALFDEINHISWFDLNIYEQDSQVDIDRALLHSCNTHNDISHFQKLNERFGLIICRRYLSRDEITEKNRQEKINNNDEYDDNPIHYEHNYILIDACHFNTKILDYEQLQFLKRIIKETDSEIFFINSNILQLFKTERGAIIKSFYDGNEYIVGIKKSDITFIENIMDVFPFFTPFYERYTDVIDVGYRQDVGPEKYITLRKKDSYKNIEDIYENITLL